MTVPDTDTEVECRIKHSEKYITELEDKLRDYKDVVVQRDEIQGKMSAGLAMLDSMKTKQTDMFYELICEHDRLIRESDERRGQLIDVQEDNERLRRELEQLCNKVDEQEATVVELEAIRSTMWNETEKLRKRCAEVTMASKAIQDAQLQAELELKLKEQELACAQHALAEKIAEYGRLEKKACAEEDSNELLRTSVVDLKARNERTVRLLQDELNELEGKLDEKSAELTAVNRKLSDAREEADAERKKTANLKRAIGELRGEYYRETCRSNEEIARLGAEVKATAAELQSVGVRLCDAQAEDAVLRSRLNDQDEAIKRMESTRERLQQEARRVREATELTADMIRTECEQHEREKKNAERKLSAKAKEECELRQQLKKQTEQVKQLKKEIFDIKCNGSAADEGGCEPDSAEVLRAKLCVNEILGDCSGEEEPLRLSHPSCGLSTGAEKGCTNA